MAKKMCYKKGTKKVSTPKYEFGAQKMFVPPKADLSDAISPISTGIGLGSQLGGPFGAVAGAGFGLAVGAANVLEKNQAAKYAGKRNDQIDAYNNNFNRNVDPRFQQPQYPDGTKKLTAKEQGELNRKSRVEKFKDTPNIDMKLNQEAISMGKNEHGLPKGERKIKEDKKVGGEGGSESNTPKFRASMYAEGTEEVKPSKPIEVEKKELIFSKDGNGNFILKEDHLNSPTHENGGKKTIGVEGDIIFPADMRDQVLEAYNAGDHVKLESLRQTLPTDTKQKFETGGKVKTSPKKTIAEVAYEKHLEKKNTEKKLFPTFETGVKELHTITPAEVRDIPEPKKSVMLHGSFAKFENGTASLSIKKDAVNPAAIVYTDATDLNNIKPNKYAFNYPKHTYPGYQPSEQVPDAIGYGTYLANEYRNGSGNITPEINSKKMKYRKGTKGINTYQDGSFGLTGMGNLDPFFPERYSYAPVETPMSNSGAFNTTQAELPSYSYASPEIPQANSGLFNQGSGMFASGAGTKATNFTPQSNNINLGGLAGALGTTAELAPTLYNTFRSLSKPIETERRFYNPEEYQRIDRYDPERRAAQESYRIEADNLKKNTGGSLGLFLSNQAQASNRRFGRLQDINNRLISDYRTTDNANVDLRNTAKQMNLGLANQYDQQDLQNVAQGQNIGAMATTGLSDYLQQRRLDKGLSDRDQSLLNLIGTNNYGVEKDKSGRWSLRYKK